MLCVQALTQAPFFVRCCSSLAPEKLGIWRLLEPTQFEAGKKADEKSVLNYLCTLISAAQGRQDADVLRAEKERCCAPSSAVPFLLVFR